MCVHCCVFELDNSLVFVSLGLCLFCSGFPCELVTSSKSLHSLLVGLKRPAVCVVFCVICSVLWPGIVGQRGFDSF